MAPQLYGHITLDYTSTSRWTTRMAPQLHVWAYYVVLHVIQVDETHVWCHNCVGILRRIIREQVDEPHVDCHDCSEYLTLCNDMCVFSSTLRTPLTIKVYYKTLWWLHTLQQILTLIIQVMLYGGGLARTLQMSVARPPSRTPTLTPPCAPSALSAPRGSANSSRTLGKSE